MSILEIIGLAFLGLGGLILQSKKYFRFIGFFNLLLAVSIILLVKPFVGGTDHEALYGLLALLGLNFVISKLSILHKVGIRVIIPLVSFGLYFYLFKTESITILGEEYTILNKFIISGVVFSMLAFEFGALKELVITKIFKGLESAEILKSVMILFMALAVFLGGFASASFGLLLIAVSYVTSSFYRNDDSPSYAASFLTLPILAVLISLTGETEVNLLGSDVLEGLFIGVFGAYFINQLWEATNRFILFIGYVLFIGLSAGLLLLQTVYGQMGGMDAFIGVLVGAAVVNLIKGKGYIGQTILIFLLLAGMLLSPLINVDRDNLPNEIEGSETSVMLEEVVPMTAADLTELKGAFELNPSASNISFFLGKKDETKGKFSNVSGEFIFGERIENTTLSIELKMEDFSTFNAFRDESLMGDEYFKADKFPIMTYKGSSLSILSENEYEINGKFMMLGVVKDLKVSLASFIKEGKYILKGKGEIDRREFGMAPSATEGNIVSFEYEVELKDQ